MRRFWLSVGALMGLWTVGCASRLAVDLVYERSAAPADKAASAPAP